MFFNIFLFCLKGDSENLRPNLTKSKKLLGIEVLKGVQWIACRINLDNVTSNILGTHFSYKEILQEFFYKTVTDTQRVFKIWKTRNVSLEGKIVIFKTKAIYQVKKFFPIIYNSCLKTCCI